MKHSCYIFITLLFLTAGSANATTHIINFGGQNGSPTFGYAPSSLTVNVGDTIIWMGDFSAPHTLVTTSVPGGAASISKTDQAGTSFTYMVTVAGSYQYECTIHASLGMKGSFTAAAAGVEIPADTRLMMDPIYPNPSVEEAMIHFTIENPGHVTIRLFDATGKLAMTPVDETMDAGHHMVMIDTKQLVSGSYQYVLQEGDAVLRQAMIVVK